MKIAAKLALHPAGNRSHVQLFVHHQLAVENNPQHPWRDAVQIHLLVGQLVVLLNPLLVLIHDRLGDLRIVVNLRHRRHLLQRRKFKVALHVFRRLFRLAPRFLQVHRQTRRPDALRNVDNLRQARHSERHVLRRYTSKVERV